MLNKIFSGIENTPITVKSWLVTVFAIVIIRAYLENFVGLSPDVSMTTRSQTLVHYFLFWMATMMACALVIHLVTKRNIILVCWLSFLRRL